MVGCVREAKAQREACEAQKGGEEGQSGSRAEAHGMAGSQNSRSGEGSKHGREWMVVGAEGWAFVVWCAGNEIGEAGVKHVSAMLEKNTTLLKLDLTCKHDEHGACRVGQRAW